MTRAEACTVLAEMTRQCFAARAEANELRAWLRAALKTLIDQCRENERLREQLRREREQHAALREWILERQEAA